MNWSKVDSTKGDLVNLHSTFKEMLGHHPFFYFKNSLFLTLEKGNTFIRLEIVWSHIGSDNSIKHLFVFPEGNLPNR